MRARSVLARGTVLWVAALILVFASVNGAVGAVGKALRVGGRNCSGPVDDATCAAATATTTLNWDQTAADVPSTLGLIAVGEPGIMGATYPSYVFDTGEIVAVEGFGADWGGFFYGVDGGVVGSSESDGFGVRGEGGTGVEASGTEVGLDATGPLGIQASGEFVGLDATGPLGIHASGDVALQADGAVSFSSAGLVSIPAGSDRKTVIPGVDIGPQSKVLATVQSPTGNLDRVIRHAGADSITIRLKAAATQQVTVAYFVIA